ncbi:hypothetical protein L6452_08033 [Arctium lappa]|uniref:Uncharacterized protein n=1 Tax=Arctium lappa TaxID=4217 RepID=A0ACB9DH65_ARCLA|nr:hypothetical protein L6452_08033 [Arctium lappa]
MYKQWDLLLLDPWPKLHQSKVTPFVPMNLSVLCEILISKVVVPDDMLACTILAGKRINSTKRLPPSTVSYSFYILSAQCRVESESIRKSEFFGELRKAEPSQHVVEMRESLESSQSSPPENDTGHPIATPTKSTPLIPMTEIKDGTQKSKPSVIEGNDNKQRRSPASFRNSWDSSHYRHRRHHRHCHLPIKKVQKPPPETGDKEICFRIQTAWVVGRVVDAGGGGGRDNQLWSAPGRGGR